jgi:hypothetical protein
MKVIKAVLLGAAFFAVAFVFFRSPGGEGGRSPASAGSVLQPVADPSPAPADPPETAAHQPAGPVESRSADALSLLSGGGSTDVPWTGKSPAAKRARRVNPDPVWMTTDPVLKEGDRITLALFEDAVFDATISDVTCYPNGAVGVTAHLQGEFGGTLYLSYSEQQLRVSVEAESRGTYYVRFSPETSEHVAIEVDKENSIILEGAESPVADAVLQPAEDIASDSSVDPVAAADAPAGYTTVDVMVVYTPAALAYEGNTANMEANIAEAMQRANEAHVNSDTQVYMRLVQSAEVDYTESDYATDLDRLTYDNDGYMDEVHTLRDSCGADFVCLFSSRTDTGGVGWLLNSTSGRADLAFCLARVQQTDWTYTVVHEWGHNMGCHHSENQVVQAGPGLYSYSSGWQWADSQSGYDGYCTVMTYQDYDNDGAYDYLRVAYFSNPDINYTGSVVNATGHATDGDNARTMRQMKDILAAYRATVVDPDPDPDPEPETTNYSYSVSFENDFDGWSYSDGDFSWTRNTGGTPTGKTGPSSAADGSWYVYTESEGHAGQTAWLSRTFDFSSVSELELGFMYMMYGSKMGTLSVAASTNNGAQWTELWSVSGDQGLAWRQVVLSLDAYEGQSNVTIRFAGLVADSLKSDIALDLITVTGVVAVAVVDMDGDLDDDGLPDEWETLYFGGTEAGPAATASNGVNTLLEAYVAGLDPNDPDALFSITLVPEAVAGQDSSALETIGSIEPPIDLPPDEDSYVLSWTSVSGRVYSIWRSASLQTNFESLATNIFWPQSSYTDTVFSTENFYRIDVQLTE